LSEVEASAAEAVDSDELMSAAQQPERPKERGFFRRFLKS